MVPIGRAAGYLAAMADATWFALVGATCALIAVLADRWLRRRQASEQASDVKLARDMEKAYVEQFATEDQITRLTRQRDDYFGIIERIEKERNQWVEMWRTQSSEHLTAQGMLSRELAKTRQVAARAVHMLNQMRKKSDQEPIKGPDGLLPYDGEPCHEPENYANRLLELRNALSEPICGKCERCDSDAADEADARDLGDFS